MHLCAYRPNRAPNVGPSSASLVPASRFGDTVQLRLLPVTYLVGIAHKPHSSRLDTPTISEAVIGRQSMGTDC